MSDKPLSIQDDFWKSLSSAGAVFPIECCVAVENRTARSLVEIHVFQEGEVLDYAGNNSAFCFNAASLARVVEVANLVGVKEVTPVGKSRYEGGLTIDRVHRQILGV